MRNRCKSRCPNGRTCYCCRRVLHLQYSIVIIVVAAAAVVVIVVVVVVVVGVTVMVVVAMVTFLHTLIK